MQSLKNIKKIFTMCIITFLFFIESFYHKNNKISQIINTEKKLGKVLDKSLQILLCFILSLPLFIVTFLVLLIFHLFTKNSLQAYIVMLVLYFNLTLPFLLIYYLNLKNSNFRISYYFPKIVLTFKYLNFKEEFKKAIIFILLFISIPSASLWYLSRVIHFKTTSTVYFICFFIVLTLAFVIYTEATVDKFEKAKRQFFMYFLYFIIFFNCSFLGTNISFLSATITFLGLLFILPTIISALKEIYLNLNASYESEVLNKMEEYLSEFIL
ncbi:MAG: hypothetical protein ACRDCW_11215 [Sarcina sp.]